MALSGPAADRLTSPTVPSDRISVLDVLRGFALFGVLLINMTDLAGEPVLLIDYPGGADPLDAFPIAFFVKERFMALFAMLFGVGVAFQIQRATDKGVPFLGTYARRMLILFGFGMVHFVFYRGDILTRYALVGMLVVPFYRLPLRWIIASAIFFLGVHALLPLAFHASSTLRGGLDQFREILKFLPHADETCGRLHAAFGRRFQALYAFASFGQMRTMEACRFAWEASGWVGGTMILTLFLVGLAFGKARFFHRTDLLRPQIAYGTVIAAVIGFALLGLGYVFPEEVGALGDASRRFLRTAGVALSALSYAGVVILIFITVPGRRFLLPLAAMGRMALTVYIGNSVLSAWLFQGWGMGWGNYPGLGALVPLAVAIYLSEILACNLWLGYFRFGPLEWLWRTLTYRRRQPMLKGAEP
jgi:uncharacterized protein